MNKSRVSQQIQPDDNTHPGHQAQGQDEIHDIDGTGEPHKPIQEQDEQNQAHGGHCHRLDHVHEIDQAGVAPHAAVEIEPVEEGDLHQHDERQRHLQGRQEWLGYAPLETQQVGAHVGAHHQDDVQRKDKPEITVFNEILHLAKNAAFSLIFCLFPSTIHYPLLFLSPIAPGLFPIFPLNSNNLNLKT